MKKVSTLEAALLGSSSALGINWMYDRPYLDAYLKDKNPLFLPIDHTAYAESKNSYDVYPNHQIGDVDFMGEVVYLLHQFLDADNGNKLSLFRKSFYDFFGPNGSYDGYIEKYGKELINAMNEGKNDEVFTSYIDTQLIGPALFMAVYDVDYLVEKVTTTLDFAKIFTAYDGVEGFVDLLNHLFRDLENGKDKHQALLDNMEYAPKKYKVMLRKSLSDINQEEFIEKYAGIACDLKQSFPLIYYIVDKTNSWEEALRLNAALGGASSARGIFISAIFNLMDDIPDKYINKLNYKI